MTDYYLGLGYGHTYSVGEYDQKPILPVTNEEPINELEFHMEDDPVPYADIVQDWKENLEDGDTLTVIYPNQETLYILDEWAEDYAIPNNEKEEQYTSEGIEETYIHFIDAEEQNWYWLVNAQVDHYDEDGRPVPLVPANE